MKDKIDEIDDALKKIIIDGYRKEIQVMGLNDKYDREILFPLYVCAFLNGIKYVESQLIG